MQVALSHQPPEERNADIPKPTVHRAAQVWKQYNRVHQVLHQS